MYRFLDRAVGDLDEKDHFLLAAIRVWVSRARSGACPCAGLHGGFASCGVAAALPDFAMAMSALDRDASITLRFRARCSARVGEDEARLLALFAAARTDGPERVRRIAATLVDDEAAPTLATAVEYVTMALGNGTFVERDA